MRLLDTRLLGALLVCHAAAAQIITTIAGSGWRFPSPPPPPVSAPIGQPNYVTVDGTGNAIFSDPDDNLVFRLNPGGTMTLLAGNGVAGFSGDGGLATSAAMSEPAALAIDPMGNLYIADSNNNRIRRVGANGTITTVAGNGISGFFGDGGPALAAELNNPTGLAFDSSGNIYIVDQGNYRVRRINVNGMISTFAGNGVSSFSGDGGPAQRASFTQPSRVAVDASGNVYIADPASNRVRRVSLSGIVTTFAGNGNEGYGGDGGPATEAMLSMPECVAVDQLGDVYITDYLNNRVRMVSGNGTISTVVGNGNKGFSGDGGPALNAELSFPNGIAVAPTGTLFIADDGNSRIRSVSAPNSTITTVAGNGTYRFSGDGGPATSAALRTPWGVAADSQGAVYIADAYESRVRKIAPSGVISTIAGTGTYGYSTGNGIGTDATLAFPLGVSVSPTQQVYIADTYNCIVRMVNADGAITTVAGNGICEFGGDGGPATMASLSDPSGVAVDAAGNLFIADSVNSRIRKVSGGIITTVAGTGAAGFSGDGGPAAKALLNDPQRVWIDSSGNLYIADTGNNRVRLLSPSGIITTIAGGGSPRDGLGDGGAPTAASLASPWGGTTDLSGAIYVADLGHERVRKIANGVISTLAGNGAFGFAGDGGPAAAASLADPYDVAVDGSGNVYIADLENSRVRMVPASPPAVVNVVAGDSLTLTQASGGRAVTANLNVDAAIAGDGSVSVSGMAYSASATTGSSWLSVSPLNGSTPGLITVTADPLNLAPGTYNGVVVLSVSLANPPMQTVNVQFTVTPGVPPAISVDQSHISFTYATTSAARSQTLVVSNSGGGSLNFTTSTSLNSGVSANWLSVTLQTGTATPGNPVALAVKADPSSLPPGTYTGSLTVAGGSAGSVAIPITMTITANPLVMLLSQAGLTFTAVQNGGAIPPQTFGVLSLGSGALNWSVQTSTLPAGGGWLMATPGSGSSNAALSAPLVTVSVNPAGLQPGVYYGLVQVVSAGAANTPQAVVAVLQVLPAGSVVAPIVQPSSLIFTAPAGVSSPSSQNVLVYDPTGTSKSFSSGVVTNGSGQLVTLPTDATISPTEPTQIVVQPIVNGLAPGTYPGTLTLQFSDGRVNAVGISFVVTGSGSSNTSERPTPYGRGSVSTSSSATSTCTPTKLIPALTTLGPSFAVFLGYPTGLSAQVMDDCGNPQTSGHVTVTFTNGDPPLGLTSLNNGTWQATWYAGAKAGQPVKLTVTAVDPQLQISGTAEVDGGISASQQQPMILPGGVVSAASPVSFTALAPGGIISIYGSLLADSAAPATSIPLPTTLGNANVIIAGQTVPLFYASPGQINAVVPFGLNTNTAYSVLVQRDLAISSPFAVNIADAQPGAFLSGGSAIVEDYRGTPPAFLVSPSAPVQAGDLLVIYCAGLGVTNPAVADGVASPGSPPAQAQAPVMVLIGGQTANVLFAGLTPTLVGLYQVNVVMPAGVTPGNAVPVMLTVAGQTSPAAIIATQ